MNTDKIDTLCIDDVEIPCCFQFPETRLFFERYLLEKRYDQEPYVYVSAKDWREYLKQFPELKKDTYGEIKILAHLVSDYLTEYKRTLLHGVAFVYKEKAWILSAESGTGKTTQYLNLKELLGDEIEMICGDFPVLHFVQDGTIMTGPSPWNGKEGYSGNRKAELGAIILLKQGSVNEFVPLSSSETVVPLFHQIITYMKTETVIHKQISYERKLIESVPVVQYINTGKPESGILLLEQIERFLND